MQLKSVQTLSIILIISIPAILSCNKEPDPVPSVYSDWIRNPNNPVLRDTVDAGNYEVASDATVFTDEEGTLRMIYMGDVSDRASIKLATKSDATGNHWHEDIPLLYAEGSSGLDSEKETPYYRKDANGKHQIYYIGYDDNETYHTQLFLAEADSLKGPYTQMQNPVVARGIIADKDIYCITSPSVVSVDDTLYLAFIGWNNHPDVADTIWVMGGESYDCGHTWENLREVEVPIGMEGQITPSPTGGFVAVRTGEYQSGEAIFYAQSDHPFEGWIENETPILIQSGSELEKDEVIAPQVYFESGSHRQHLFYTGADYDKGWWIMEAVSE